MNKIASFIFAVTCLLSVYGLLVLILSIDVLLGG